MIKMIIEQASRKYRYIVEIVRHYHPPLFFSFDKKIFSLTYKIVLLTIFLYSLFYVSYVIDLYRGSDLIYFAKSRLFKWQVETLCIITSLKLFFNIPSSKKVALLSLAIPAIWISVYFTVHVLLNGTNAYYYYYHASIYLFFIIIISIEILSRSKLSKSYFFIGEAILMVLLFVSEIPALIFGMYSIKYHSIFDEISWMAILETNISEAIQYIQSMIPLWQIVLFFLVSLVVPFFIIMDIKKIRDKNNIYNASMLSIAKTAILIILVIVLTRFLIVQHNFFPLDVHHRLMQGNSTELFSSYHKMKENVEKNSDIIKVAPENSTATLLPGSIIVVIGESENRDHMKSFNPQYDVETTPWESSLFKSNQLIYFAKAYSNFPNTTMSLSQALTDSNQYNDRKIEDSISIIDIARKAGYHTYWISTQAGKGSVWDGVISIVAHRSEYQFWINGFDESVVEPLKNIDLNENNFIVIHIKGSHMKYEDRMPPEFKKKYMNSDNAIDAYDCSIRYTDNVLRKIYEFGKNNLKMQCMIYFSDHGENLYYGHIANPFSFDMVRIPLWIYLSPEYKEKFPDIYENLNLNRNKIFTNDLIFELVSGILHAPSQRYDSKYDLSHKKYGINIDNAKTLRGKIMIKDDE